MKEQEQSFLWRQTPDLLATSRYKKKKRKIAANEAGKKMRSKHDAPLVERRRIYTLLGAEGL